MKKPFETRTSKDCQATAKLAAYPYSLLPENEAEEGTENKEKGEEGQMEERERGMRRDKGGGKKEGGEQKGKIRNVHAKKQRSSGTYMLRWLNSCSSCSIKLASSSSDSVTVSVRGSRRSHDLADVDRRSG